MLYRHVQPPAAVDEKQPPNGLLRPPMFNSSKSVPSHCQSDHQVQDDDDENRVRLIDLSEVDFRVELIYPPFTPRIPHFIDNFDRSFFLDDPINRRYLSRPPSRELTGRVKVIRDGVIRVGGHECSWLTTDDEFVSNATEERRHQELDVSSTTLCPLLVPDGQTFQHFIDGVLPKLVQLHGVVGRSLVAVNRTVHCDDLEVTYNNIEYLLYRPRDHVIYEILELLGISRLQMRFVTPPDYEKTRDSVIRSARLIDTCVTPAVHPTLWRRARHLLVGPLQSTGRHQQQPDDLVGDKLKWDRDESSANIVTVERNENNTNLINQSTSRRESTDLEGSPLSSVSPRWIILLSRRRSRNRGRRLLNERAIFDQLVSHFGRSNVVLYPDRRATSSGRSDGSLAVARRVFATARLVVGVHGGAFYNIIMAPVNCTVIEVMPLTETYGRRRVPPGLAHTIVWRMSEALGHNYWRLYEATSEGHGDVTLPVDRLRTVLDNI